MWIKFALFEEQGDQAAWSRVYKMNWRLDRSKYRKTSVGAFTSTEAQVRNDSILEE